MVDKITSIQLRKSTRDALAALGGKDDTFEDIILRLIEAYKEQQ